MRGHLGNISSYYNGTTIVADYSNGNIYTFDPTVFTDNGAVVLREVISKHQLKGFKPLQDPADLSRHGDRRRDAHGQ